MKWNGKLSIRDEDNNNFLMKVKNKNVQSTLKNLICTKYEKICITQCYHGLSNFNDLCSVPVWDRIEAFHFVLYIVICEIDTCA